MGYVCLFSFSCSFCLIFSLFGWLRMQVELKLFHNYCHYLCSLYLCHFTHVGVVLIEVTGFFVVQGFHIFFFMGSHLFSGFCDLKVWNH